MNIYLFYLGGKAGRSMIEVHDLQCVVAETPEEAYPILRQHWFGDLKTLHIDGYMLLDWADGYDILLSTTPSTDHRRLFFVNMGGYQAHHLAELHAFDFFVAESSQEAKEKAKQSLLKEVLQPHKDDLCAVDDCLLLDQIGRVFIHLRENPNGTRCQPAWQGYLPIGEE